VRLYHFHYFLERKIQFSWSNTFFKGLRLFFAPLALCATKMTLFSEAHNWAQALMVVPPTRHQQELRSVDLQANLFLRRAKTRAQGTKWNVTSPWHDVRWVYSSRDMSPKLLFPSTLESLQLGLRQKTTMATDVFWSNAEWSPSPSIGILL